MQYFAEGFIYDESGALIRNVVIQLVDKYGLFITEPFLVVDGNYSAWTDRNPNEISVSFKKAGYKDSKVLISTLQTEPDVILMKGSDNVSWSYIMLVLGAVMLYRNQTKKVGALGASDVLPIILLTGGVLGFSVIKKVLESIGLWSSQDSKDLDAAGSSASSWWNPNFYKTKPYNIPYTNPITSTTAKVLAEKLYSSFGPFNDDEESAISVFKSLPSQSAGSYVSESFLNRYGQDMLTFLRGGVWPQDRLSDADVAVINRYVNSLPKY